MEDLCTTCLFCFYSFLCMDSMMRVQGPIYIMIFNVEVTNDEITIKNKKLG